MDRSLTRTAPGGKDDRTDARALRSATGRRSRRKVGTSYRARLRCRTVEDHGHGRPHDEHDRKQRHRAAARGGRHSRPGSRNEPIAFRHPGEHQHRFVERPCGDRMHPFRNRSEPLKRSESAAVIQLGPAGPEQASSFRDYDAPPMHGRLSLAAVGAISAAIASGTLAAGSAAPPGSWAVQANKVCVVWLAKAKKEFGSPVTPAQLYSFAIKAKTLETQELAILEQIPGTTATGTAALAAVRVDIADVGSAITAWNRGNSSRRLSSAT